MEITDRPRHSSQAHKLKMCEYIARVFSSSINCVLFRMLSPLVLTHLNYTVSLQLLHLCKMILSLSRSLSTLMLLTLWMRQSGDLQWERQTILFRFAFLPDLQESIHELWKWMIMIWNKNFRSFKSIVIVGTTFSMPDKHFLFYLYFAFSRSSLNRKCMKRHASARTKISITTGGT